MKTKKLKIVEPKSISPLNRWKEKITDVWEGITDRIIECGKLLCEAKEDLEYGKWMTLVKEELPFSQSTSNQLMHIYKRFHNDNKNSDFENNVSTSILKSLPKSYRSIYTLSKIDDEKLIDYIDKGDIHPSMTITDANIVAKKHLWESRKLVLPKTLRKPKDIQIYNEDFFTGSPKYIEDNSIDLVITDPPYGIDYRSDNQTRRMNGGWNILPGYVDIPENEYGDFCIKFINEIERILKPNGSVYVVMGTKNLYYIMNGFHQSNLIEKSHLIWRTNFGNIYVYDNYQQTHRHILFYTKSKTGNHKFNEYDFFADDGKKRYEHLRSVWDIPSVSNDKNKKNGKKSWKNANQLPEDLVEKCIRYSSDVGDKVLDPFLGSMTTARVSAKLKRIPLGFEVNKVAYSYFLPDVKKLLKKQKK
jgi:site-specific DNA-methyltransferase (adenine-specific)